MRALFSAVFLLLSFCSAFAQNFPTKSVRIVVPFGPGSGADIATRYLAQQLESGFKQSVIVENKPGANGAIGAMNVARATADGLTLLMGTNSTHGANPGLVAKLGYDPVKDFVPVCMVGVFGSFLVVHPSLPVRTPAELVAYGKANPDKLSFAAGNTSSLIMGEMFAKSTGIRMLRVPYTSNPLGLTDVMAGRVDVMFPDIASSQVHVKSGAVRALGVVTLGDRTPLAPELPTVSETTIPNFHFVGWIGLFAPANTPAPVVQKIAAEVQKVLSQAEAIQRLQQLGAEAKWMGPTEYTPFVANEVKRLTGILADIGIKPQ